MRRRTVALLCVVAMLIACSPGVSWAGERTRPSEPVAPAGVVSPSAPDDDIPGVPLPAGPIEGTLTAGVDEYDVYSFGLEAGEEVTFILDEPAGGADIDLKLYGPSTTSVGSAPISYLDTGHYPEAVQWTASVAGEFYIAVFDYAHVDTTYTFDWTVVRGADSDNVPGVPLPESPIIGNVDALDLDDVYRVFMRKGDTFTFTLLDANQNIEPAYDLYLYGPGTEDVLVDPYLEATLTGAAPEVLEWTAVETGWYYLDVYSQQQDHAYTLEWEATYTPLKVVYRFYVPTRGTHFYSADPEEVARVQATMSATYRLEGVGYVLNPLSNTSSLHRFFNRRTGTHFYTADETEKANVQANLAATFQYDGVAYDVMREDGPARITVWRFLNIRNGTHFYTCDEGEKASIAANLGHTYRLEGPAFYLGQ